MSEVEEKEEREAVVWQLKMCEAADTEHRFRNFVEEVLDEADETFAVMDRAGWEFLAGIGIAVYAHPSRDAVVWRSGGKWLVTSKATLELLGVLEVEYQTSECYDERVAAEQRGEER